MKLLHLLVDDKFIDAAIREFEAVEPGLHEYLIVGARPPYRHLRDARVRAVTAAQWQKRVAQPDVAAVLLHGLPPAHYPLLQVVPAGPTVVWLGWGYDYYGLLNDAFPEGLLLPETRRLMAALYRRTPQPAPGVMTASELSVGRPYAKPTPEACRLLSRVDVASFVLPEEYRLVRQHNPWFRARVQAWNYLTMEDDLVLTDTVPPAQQPNILLGNSATPTNNHLEAFALLRERADLDGRQLIVPLSYGDTHYAEAVIGAGRRAFGGAFIPLRQYLPREQYIELLQSCGTVLMNHVRQQAVGNLLISGLLGARLFVQARNPVGAWLAHCGVRVEDANDFHLRPMDEIERRLNADAIANFANRAARRRQTAALIASLPALAQRIAA